MERAWIAKRATFGNQTFKRRCFGGQAIFLDFVEENQMIPFDRHTTSFVVSLSPDLDTVVAAENDVILEVPIASFGTKNRSFSLPGQTHPTLTSYEASFMFREGDIKQFQNSPLISNKASKKNRKERKSKKSAHYPTKTLDL